MAHFNRTGCLESDSQVSFKGVDLQGVTEIIFRELTAAPADGSGLECQTKDLTAYI